MKNAIVDLSKKLVLVDRDGVLNADRGNYVRHPRDLCVLSNAMRAIAQLHAAGIRVGVCTNQGGVDRGYYDEQTLKAIHKKLLAHVHAFGGDIARIVFCTSYDNSNPNRKPNPGMLLDQAAYFSVDLAGVPFVGDNFTDIQAARNAGAVPVLVKTGKGRNVTEFYKGKLEDVHIYPNFEEAVRSWLT